MGFLAEPSSWRAVSSVLLIAFAVSFLASGFSVPRWGWIALILSGVTFGVELLLLLARAR